jgi:hypothetical protein
MYTSKRETTNFLKIIKFTEGENLKILPLEIRAFS